MSRQHGPTTLYAWGWRATHLPFLVVTRDNGPQWSHLRQTLWAPRCGDRLMPRAPWAAEAVYTAAERFVDECVRKDGSLFTPGQPVWTGANAADLFDRVGPWGEGGSFWDKLDGQVESASDEVRQLAAEAMFVQYLGEDKTRGSTKRATLEHLLAPVGVEIPLELDEALESGLSDPGAGKAHRPTYLRSLLDFARRWKEITDVEQARLLGDPWGFRDFVDSGGAQAEVLIHLVFPETFEPIGSARAKQKVAQTFALLPGVADEVDIDRKLALIRTQLSAILGEDFGFYNSPAEPVWTQSEPAEWSAFLEWAERLHPRGDWNETERDYKLVIGANLRAAWEALDGQDWLSLLRTAFGRPNNLTNRFEHGPFLDWAENNPAQARDLLRELWEGDYGSVLRGAMFLVPTDVLPGRAARAAIASFLLLGRDATQYPFFRNTVYEKTSKLVGRETVSQEATVEDLYDDFVALLDELRVRFLTRGVEIDRLDAQGLAWWITSSEPPEDWSPDDRQAFLRYQGGDSRSAQRAWLVRGANNHGRNMLPEWFEQGFASIGWDNATPHPLDATVEEIREYLRTDLPKLPEGEIVRGSGIRKRFLDIAPGDLIVTPEEDNLYVARATGDAYWNDGDDAAALQRPVEWMNLGQPASRAAVREHAPGLWSSLRTLLTVSELTEHADAIAALLESNGDEEVAHEPTGIPRATDKLASDLFLRRNWLQEIVDLLNEKRQVIFYGPPGTGKTYVARALGKHVEDAGGTWTLVQFHPAYSYEDFIEGFRPTEGGQGLEFTLMPGPLRGIAERAETNPSVPHLLVIDEINRGNIAKIFGELYFLLEYRNEPIHLQYSPQKEFSLPKNLYFVGTMNTADRSIALVDSALRRRFYFASFFPREDPLRTVLGDWLKARGYDAHIADLHAELNEALAESGAEEEFAIGHSYFMSDGPPNVDRIWSRAIMPLLEERFYGARSRNEIEQEFGVDAIRRRLRADEAPEVVADADL